MTDSISRRSLVGVVGATVALAACKAPEDQAQPNVEANANLKMFGPGFVFGRPTYEQRPNNSDASLKFNPKYLTALYLRFGRQTAEPRDRKLLVRHAYATIPNDATADQIQTLAESELLAARRNTLGQWRRPNQGPQWRREENFERFDFDSQNKIFMLVDHDESDIKFDDRAEQSVTPTRLANLVRFTPFQGQAESTTIDYNAVAEPNNAFFNARIVSPVTTNFPRRKILTLENWYTDRDGKPLTGTPKLRYSMNVHLLVAGENGKWIPLIIDPDTGNGMGNNP